MLLQWCALEAIKFNVKKTVIKNLEGGVQNLESGLSGEGSRRSVFCMRQPGENGIF